MTPSPHPLLSLLRRRRLLVAGANSGTSADGLDLALVEITNAKSGPRVRDVNARHFAYPPSLRRTLMTLASDPDISKEMVARAHLALGEFVARCVNADTRPPMRHGRRIDLIGSHGQTIAHYAGRPGKRSSGENATWQIGALPVIAQRTGIVTIGDFRVADVAAGGMGAPLSGYYHHLLFGKGAVVLNLGGIANVSVSCRRRGSAPLSASRRLKIIAFDTGPGNMWLDALAQRLVGRPYDQDGRTAAVGTPIPKIVRSALAMRYFRHPPPKTCGREEFGQESMQRVFFRQRTTNPTVADLLATGVEITAQSVAMAVERWIAGRTSSRELIVTGGGAQNRALVRRLGALLPGWQLVGPERWGIPARFVEPVGFALLAHETLRGRAGNLGGATGARESAVLGLIALPAP